MQKEKIIEILSEWNFWHQDMEIGILRENYLQALEKLHETGQVVIVTGVRRSGKSTLLRQYIKKKIQSGINKNNFLYINFEEPKFADELSLALLNQIYEAYLEILQPAVKPFLFLDEIQLIPQWEKFARALHEKNKAHLFISGSSAKILSQEFATVLTGRHVDLPVYPLSFAEFLQFKGTTAGTTVEILAHKAKIKSLLREYLQYGGFPLVVLREENIEILLKFFDDLVIKDVAERYRIKKIDKLKSLARYYLTNISSLASFRRIKPFLGISLDSVERFSYYLQEAYLIFLVPQFSYKIREQEINPKKVYSIDTGLRNLVSFTFSEDLGKLYENIIFLELFRRKEEIYYWQDKGECDFVVWEGKKCKEVLQVCYQITAENKAREVQGLLEAMEKFKVASGSIITEDYEEVEKIQQKEVRFVPLWKWLLQKSNDNVRA